ncbi:glycoside hydrolase family 43 protein [Tricladium varicosporioides]|nr:glycoside hydrolase family 43 protein [Hymenoscyphus varicosporioides]
MIFFIQFVSIAALGLLSTARAFSNPIKTQNGSDPFMVWYGGVYYLTTTSWTDIRITSATTIEGLKKATPKVVWIDSTTSRCCNIWSPELYLLDGYWYIYYGAGPKSDDVASTQRIFVLKGGSGNPLSSSYSFVKQIKPSNYDAGMIDPSIFKAGNSKTYFLFSAWPSGGQSIYISELTSPTSIGPATLLSQPTLSWEQVGAGVEANPVGISHGGLDFITFSASLCSTSSASLGLLTLRKGSDPLSASSWVKSQNPAFKNANGLYGTAGNTFFRSPDGTEDWMVFHVNRKEGGVCDGNRQTMAQKVNWGSDGKIDLGVPLPPDVGLLPPSGEGVGSLL